MGSRRLVLVSDVTPGAEDLKIITLARSTRARVAASEGAAVRDETGRTYTAAAVALPSLRLSALRLAVAMASSSGAQKLEAAALVSDSDAADPADLAVLRDLGPSVTLFLAGTVISGIAVGLVFRGGLSELGRLAEPARRAQVMSAFFAAASASLSCRNCGRMSGSLSGGATLAPLSAASSGGTPCSM